MRQTLHTTGRQDKWQVAMPQTVRNAAIKPEQGNEKT